MNQQLDDAGRTIAKWREDLTDFTTRNPLLFFKPSKTSNLVLENDATELIRRLQAGANIPLTELRALPFSTGRLGVPPELPDVDNICTKVRRKARTVVEESGINPLALAIDLCTWRDPLALTGTARNCNAPIVIVPITITHVSRGNAYLSLDPGSDIVINPVLRRAFSRHFNGTITLSADPIGDTPSLADYLSVVNPHREDSRFTFASNVALGLFSFSRLVMVDDLERNEERIRAHPLIKSILGLAPDAPAPTLPRPETLDSQPNGHSDHSVLDADSSQQAAVEAIKAGNSLIIQGPPGTGKSQTITNIIAELLADGKKVLFVSQKRAALDVVLHRLEDTGLRDLCLAAHDNADKKAVVQDLYNTCERARILTLAPKTGAALEAKLRQRRQDLSNHVSLLHAMDPGMETSVFEAYGTLAVSRDAPSLALTVPDARLFSQNCIARVQGMLKDLAPYAQILFKHEHSLWHDVQVDRVGAPEKHLQIAGWLQTLESEIGAVGQVCDEIAALTGISMPDLRVSTVGWTLKVAEACANGPGLDDALMVEDTRRLPAYQLVCQHLEAYRKQREMLLAAYDEGLLALPVEELSAKFTSAYSSSLKRLFNSGYNRDRALLADLQRKDAPAPSRKPDYNSLRNAVVSASQVGERKRSLDEAGTGREMFGHYYCGTDTDTVVVKRAMDQAASLTQLVAERSDPRAICARISRGNAIQRLSDLAAEGRRALEALNLAKSQICALFPANKLRDWREDTDLATAQHVAIQLRQELPKLEDWVVYQRLLHQMEEAGFHNLPQSLESSKLAPHFWSSAFELGMLRAWVELQHVRHPELGHFSAEHRKKTIEEFAALDQEHLSNAQVAIRQAHAAAVQNFLFRNTVAQYRRLAQEANKTRQIWPIRKLLTQIPELLLQVKPCWMMSPLTVTQMVDVARTQFDVVVFDEASQIKVEEGVCAILRAQQVVVVGDDKQLPPTSFFDQGLVEDADPESDDRAYQSILDRCAGHLPDCTLRWHYRSRDETLIAFSNHAFYNDNLITFPNAEQRPDTGVRFRHVPDGVYDRGGTKTNQREAAVVARLIVNHYRAGGSSLGVIALSEPQQDAIRDALQRELDKHPDLAITEDGHDALFIKNLENVQGDERDAIILSIGYGRDAKGSFTLNFGPLNKQGGERRLNVAVTRARHVLTVVSSITDADIDLGKSQSKGVEHLRDYLAYARTGGASQTTKSTAGAALMTQLCADLSRHLEARNYVVEANVGRSSQRIELAIVDPQTPERYVMGVETDGPIYRSLPTVRDRDRLRDSVLHKLGWRLFRVHGTEWYRDADAVLARIYDTLQAAAAPTSPPVVRTFCPRCGLAVTKGTASCPSCGVEIRVPIPSSNSGRPPLAVEDTFSSFDTDSVLSPNSAGSVAGRPYTSPVAKQKYSTDRTQQPLPPGTLLNGKYVIEAVLGHGAFGRVYRAKDTLAQRPATVAIKEMLDYHNATPEEKADGVRWFKREVGTLLQISHANIPTVIEYWTADKAAGPFYLAMDFIDGTTLQQRIADSGGTIPWQQAIKWGLQLCKVLKYLHSQVPPYVFRDLKPPNIMIERGTDTPKLVDFGIARQMADQANHTSIGTWGYMPIEQYMGQPETRSDLYALGATLHVMLTGKRPEERFRGLQAKGYDVPNILKHMFPRVDLYSAGIPSNVAAVIEVATAYEVKDRYADAGSMGLALARCLGMGAIGVKELAQS